MGLVLLRARIGWCARPALLKVFLLLTLILTGMSIQASPATAAPPAPSAATSFYMKTTNPDVMRRMGCALGRQVKAGARPNDALVVLAFGSPRFNGWDYGTSLFQNRFAASTLRIRVAVQAYAEGYFNCTRWHLEVHLRIGAGTSNWGPGVTFEHGRAWARMVNKANIVIGQRGWSRKVDVVGANDIEPGFGTPWAARRWVRGYDSANRWPYYNFGGLAACPPVGNCQGAWTQEDLWYVSWGAPPAWPLPQVYTSTGITAEQWYRLSLYSHKVHGTPITFVGVMSQHQACRDSSDPCRGMDNRPWEAWHQLRDALNRDDRTSQDHIRWTTDISWRN